MASKIKNSEALCATLYSVQTRAVMSPWTATNRAIWKKAVGEVDGKLPAGDAKMLVIQALGTLEEKRVTVSVKECFDQKIGGAISAIDPQWKSGPVARKRTVKRTLGAVEGDKLVTAYAAAKVIPTVPQLVEAAWPRIELAMIGALETGRFVTRYYDEAASLDQNAVDAFISLPENAVSRAAFAAQVRSKIPAELPGAVEIVQDFDSLSHKFVYGMRISLAQ